MKEELKSLGFKYKGDFYQLWINNFEISFEVIDYETHSEVYMSRLEDMMYMFDYNYDKVKQLIKLLSYENA